MSVAPPASAAGTSGESRVRASAAGAGCRFVCDDMLVLDGDAAFAGPRILDLRAESARGWGSATTAGRSALRERWRVALDDGVSDRLRFRGWVFLTWSDDVAVEASTGGERLPRLAQHLGLRVPPARPDRLLELAALPGWEFRRPRGWDRFDEAGDRLLATLAG